METMLRVNSNDVSLAVYTQGNPAHPPLLLVHGYPDDHSVWDKMMAVLSRNLHVIRYDVRGAGASDAPPRTTDYRLEQLAADLKAVMDAVSPARPVHLAAHDWGSIQSWEAVTDRRLRSRIASFTSVSGPCLDHMGFWCRSRLRRPLFRHAGQLAGQLLRSWYVMLFHLPGTGFSWRLGVARLWPWLLARTEGVTAPARAGLSRDGSVGVRLYRANFLRRLLRPGSRATEVPVQLIIPQRDLFVSPHLYDDLQQWVPRLLVNRLDAGHWLPLARPLELAERVRDFALAIEACEPDPLPLARPRITTSVVTASLRTDMTGHDMTGLKP